MNRAAVFLRPGTTTSGTGIGDMMGLPGGVRRQDRVTRLGEGQAAW